MPNFLSPATWPATAWASAPIDVWDGPRRLSLSSGFAPSALFAADFANNKYRNGSDYKTDLSALTGYSYTRSGAKSELSSTGSPLAFDANVPGIVPGVGYWSRQAFTNNILYSEDLTNAAWVAGGLSSIVNANVALAPNGVSTADQLKDNGSGGSALVGIAQSITFSTSGTKTLSFFLKADQLSWAYLTTIAYDATADGSTWFNLANGTVGTTSANHTAKIESVGNGWYRCSITFTIGADLAGQVRLFMAEADNVTTADRDGTSSIFVWGGQLVAQSVPGPYIRTTSAAATVAEDNLPITLPSALTNQDMLVWIKGTPKEVSGVNQRFGSISDGTANNRIDFYINAAGGPALYLAAGGAAIYSGVIVSAPMSVGVAAAVIVRRLGGVWRFGVYKGGALSWYDAGVAGALPANLTKFTPGNFATGTSPFRGPIAAAGIILGTFATDAEVIAAVEAF